MLSVGCGSATVEIEFAAFKEIESVVAVDIAFSQIDYARKSVSGTSIESKLDFKVLDYSRENVAGQFDVVLFNSSLHHFKDIPALLNKVCSNLRPGGLLLLNEYVGPDRFQWTDEQLMLINDLLTSIPCRYRRIFRTRLIKNKVRKPGILRMIVNDPSEAPHSAITDWNRGEQIIDQL